MVLDKAFISMGKLKLLTLFFRSYNRLSYPFPVQGKIIDENIDLLFPVPTVKSGVDY